MTLLIIYLKGYGWKERKNQQSKTYLYRYEEKLFIIHGPFPISVRIKLPMSCKLKVCINLMFPFATILIIPINILN
jgi:hypothetical protein